MARRATAIKLVKEGRSLEAASPVTSTTSVTPTPLFAGPPKNFLLLDSGDTLFGDPSVDSSQGRITVRAMNSLDYQAMALGDQEISQGLDLLENRQQEARFLILSANVGVTGQLEPSFRPYWMVDLQGRKVAIIGLTSLDARYAAPGVVRHLNIEDPFEAAQRYVQEVRKETNVVIVLSDLGLPGDRELARRVPGITLIVGGHSGDLLEQPIALEKGKEIQLSPGEQRPVDTLIVQAGKEGQNLGTLEMRIDDTGRILEFQGAVTALTNRFANDPQMEHLLQPALRPTPTPAQDNSAYAPGSLPRFLQEASPDISPTATPPVS